MPRLDLNDDTMKTMNLSGPGNFSFSGVKPEELGASEYTLATLIIDHSGSTQSFESDLLSCVKTVLESCKASPRAENLLVRLVKFNQNVTEVHGFKELEEIDVADYPAFNSTGMTSLFDAVYSSIEATEAYAKLLTAQKYDVNAAIYIVTDGSDNTSTNSIASVSDALKKVVTNETLESMVSFLIGLKDPKTGIGWEREVGRLLKEFHEEANLTEYVDMGDATPESLAKLAYNISGSISSQSQMLGSGGPSQLIF